MPQKIMARSACPNVRATVRIVRASIPQRSAEIGAIARDVLPQLPVFRASLQILHVISFLLYDHLHDRVKERHIASRLELQHVGRVVARRCAGRIMQKRCAPFTACLKKWRRPDDSRSDWRRSP